MPTVQKRSISEKTVTTTSAAKKPPKWDSLVPDIKEMDKSSLLVLTPDEGDSMRALKVQVARAAKAAGRKDDVLYGVNSNDELEVWLRDRPKATRGPRKKGEG